MNKILYVIALFFLSCGTVKKVEKIDTAISKKDTAQTIIVKGVDSISLAKNLIEKINSNKIHYNTFSAKIKVEYQDKESSEQATANIRMKKDSIIWISLTGALGIEGFRVLIKPDSVVVLNKIKKTVQYRSIEYLNYITEIPFSFSTLQNLIVGNPIFLDSNVISYRTKENETLILLMGEFFKHLITIDNTSDVITHSKLDDMDSTRNRTLDITFGDYESTAFGMFSKQRSISLAENNRLEIQLNYKQYNFNIPLSYPFNLPRNTKVK